MHISSPAFTHEGEIPESYTCDGEDKNPELVTRDIPSDTQSLALICDDPDAPGGAWVHWIMWNIPPSLEKIEEDKRPDGSTEGVNSFGARGYGGPCPPSGSHRYYFKLYALDTTLDLPPETEKEGLVEAMKGHIIDETEMMGRYERK